MIDNKELGDRIREARLALEYTQSGMAAACDSKLRSWQDYEKGKRTPGSQVIDGLVRMGINANWLFTGRGNLLIKDMPANRQDLIEHYSSVIENAEASANQWTSDLPIDVCEVDDGHFLSPILKALDRIALDDNAPDELRARADTLLATIFEDPDAEQRTKIRLGKIHTRIREARQLVSSVTSGIQYRPSTLMLHALETASFEGISESTLVLLARAIKEETGQ